MENDIKDEVEASTRRLGNVRVRGSGFGVWGLCLRALQGSWALLVAGRPNKRRTKHRALLWHVSAKLARFKRVFAPLTPLQPVRAAARRATCCV